MRTILPVLAALLSAGFLAAPARAQSAGSSGYYGPYSVYGPGLTYRQPTTYTGPYSTSVRIQTTVTVPDRGEVLLGGLSSFSEGRNEFGAPVLGKTPYLGRAFRNVGYGRDVRRTTVSVRVRVIDLAEEEERQTGVRP
jgi:type II secretory pathway component GspD/PulD (secretin)